MILTVWGEGKDLFMEEKKEGMGDDITMESIQIFEIFTKQPMSKSRTDLES